MSKYLRWWTVLVSFFFINLAQARVPWEDETSVEWIPPSHWPVGKSVGHFLNWWLMWKEGPRLLWVVLPRAGHPACYKKADWASRGGASQQEAFFCSHCLSSCSVCLPVLTPSMMDCDVEVITVRQTLSPAFCFWSCCLITTIKTSTKTASEWSGRA